MSTAQQYRDAREHLERVCEQAGRPVEDVVLVAVSKTVGKDEVADAMQAGARDFGENRPDQLVEKADAFPEARWHFIGNIQSRRLRDIVGRACLIHSLYRESHAQKIDELAREAGIVQDVLIEVNVSGEESKSGLAPDELPGMLGACAALGHVRVRGLMTMAPRGDEDTARRTFAALRTLRDEVRSTMAPDQAQDFTELSMGMSEDWPEAVEEGATIVRIGRAIFSPDFAG